MNTPSNAEIEDGIVYLSSKHVCRRYDFSGMTLHRWQTDPELGFPRPYYFNRIRYWKLADLEAWEARQPREMLPETKAQSVVATEARRAKQAARAGG